jgi:hypothetical protein
MPNEQSTFGNFQDQMGQTVYNAEYERTRYDKLLTREEIMRLRDILKKEQLTTDDISEVMNIAVSTEIKLTRLNDWDRYILGKYMIWIGEYGKRYSKALRAKEYYAKNYSILTERTKEMRNEIEKDYGGQFKQCCHAYFYLARSPLSLEGGMVDALTTDQKDIRYSGIPNNNPNLPNQGWGK